jgi:hypothetical protein
MKNTIGKNTKNEKSHWGANRERLLAQFSAIKMFGATERGPITKRIIKNLFLDLAPAYKRIPPVMKEITNRVKNLLFGCQGV